MKSERILILPKGDYSSTAKYGVLDMVLYENKYYVCIKDCKGIVPSNSEYWRMYIKNEAKDILDELGLSVINGRVYDSWEVKE